MVLPVQRRELGVERGEVVAELTFAAGDDVWTVTRTRNRTSTAGVNKLVNASGSVKVDNAGVRREQLEKLRRLRAERDDREVGAALDALTSAAALISSRGASAAADSTVAARDSAGVMPDPATTKTWSPGTDRSAVKVPDGGSTSMVSPGWTSWTR